MNIGKLSNSMYFKGIQQSIPEIFMPFQYRNCSQSKEITSLKSGEATIVPNNSQLRLGNDYTLNCRNPKLQNMLDERGSILVGTSKMANFSLPKFYNGVNSEHLRLEKQGSSLIATNLSSTKGTQIIPKDKIKPFQVGTQDLKLSQGEIGDCFVLATLYSISRTQQGQTLLEKMVKVDENGNYVVTFNNKQPIIVTPQELDSERTTNSSKTWASAEMGTKAFERAYAKMIKLDPSKCNSFQIDKGGRITDALKLITGKDCCMHRLEQQDIDSLLNSICEKDLTTQFLTCSTPLIGKYGNFVDSESKFITGHAYSIKDINTKDKTIEIVNPHNTKKSEIISWQDFKSMFEWVYVADM